MAAEEKQPRSGGAPRWMKLLLIGSLSLNLLIAGVLVGCVFSGGGWMAGHGHHMAGGGPMVRALNDTDRQLLRRRMMSDFMGRDDTRGAYRTQMQALLGDLRATPYDPAAVEARMSALRAHFLWQFENGQAILAERLAAMSDDERAAYADRLEIALAQRR